MHASDLPVSVPWVLPWRGISTRRGCSRPCGIAAPTRPGRWPANSASPRPTRSKNSRVSCDVAVICVSADADVRSVVERMAPGLARDALVIDCSTVSADTARWAAKLLAGRGVAFLDAPVSGGVEGAANGTLAIMVRRRTRGVRCARDRCSRRWARPSSISGRAARARPPRPPTRSCAPASSAPAPRPWPSPARTSLPLDRVVVDAGRRRRLELVLRAPRAEHGAREPIRPDSACKLHAKDLAICHDMAARFGVELPVVESMLAEYAQLIEQGYGDEDISATHRLKQALFKTPPVHERARARRTQRSSRTRQLYLPDFCRRARGARRRDHLRAHRAGAGAGAQRGGAWVSGPTWRAPRCS